MHGRYEEHQENLAILERCFSMQERIDIVSEDYHEGNWRFACIWAERLYAALCDVDPEQYEMLYFVGHREWDDIVPSWTEDPEENAEMMREFVRLFPGEITDKEAKKLVQRARDGEDPNEIFDDYRWQDELLYDYNEVHNQVWLPDAIADDEFWMCRMAKLTASDGRLLAFRFNCTHDGDIVSVYGPYDRYANPYEDQQEEMVYPWLHSVQIPAPLGLRSDRT